MEREAYGVMDLKALRCFLAVAQRGSLTRAGIELGISESAVSQRVKTLEGYLQVKLYEARGGRVRLTVAGERTAAMAVSMFDDLEQFERALSHGDEADEIVLSTHDIILRHYLPDRVEAFYRAHPLARLRLLARPVEETLQLVRANECDLGVVPASKLPKGLGFKAIVTYPAYLIMPKGHALGRRARENFRQLLEEETIRRYPLIIHEVQREGQLRDALQRLRLPLNTHLEVGTVDTLKHYVARGLGIAVVTGLCLTEEDRARFEIVPIPAEVGGETTYGVVMRADKHRGALLTSLLGLLGAA